MSSSNEDSYSTMLRIVYEALKRREFLLEPQEVQKLVDASDFELLVSNVIQELADLSFLLRYKELELDVTFDRKINPTLRFLDVADELGNPKSIKMRYKHKMAINIQSVEFLDWVSEQLIKWKLSEYRMHLPLHGEGSNSGNPDNNKAFLAWISRQKRNRKQPKS
jgi:hypothetical protein